MANIGPMEIVVVLVIALIVLGPKRLPELGNSLGRGLREFKDAIAGRDVPVAAPQAPDPVPEVSGQAAGERASGPG